MTTSGQGQNSHNITLLSYKSPIINYKSNQQRLMTDELFEYCTNNAICIVYRLFLLACRSFFSRSLLAISSVCNDVQRNFDNSAISSSNSSSSIPPLFGALGNDLVISRGRRRGLPTVDVLLTPSPTPTTVADVTFTAIGIGTSPPLSSTALITGNLLSTGAGSHRKQRRIRFGNCLCRKKGT